jgi:ABC-type uncharacterized transport system auxiliary subunit
MKKIILLMSALSMLAGCAIYTTPEGSSKNTTYTLDSVNKR